MSPAVEGRFGVTGLVCFLLASVGAQSHGCPVFGTDQSTGLSRSTEERVFLNFEAPSQCQGTVASWSFCHYRSEENDNSESSNSNSNSNNINGSPLYGAEFLVFRRSTTTSNIYELVAESKTSNLLPSSSVSDFSCLTVEASQSFEIQENDVVGACVWNQGTDVRPLYVVGDTNDNSANQRLYHYGGSNDCTNSQLQNISTTHNDFQQKSEWKLHLYANTDVAAFCRAGNNPPATGPATGSVSGTFLDTSNAAMCSDHITSWHYCYYPSAAPADQTYTMTVAAWRLEAGTYRLVPGTNHTVTLTPIETKAKIFCVEEALHGSSGLCAGV